jgi:hypothetical protein
MDFFDAELILGKAMQSLVSIATTSSVGCPLCKHVK